MLVGIDIGTTHIKVAGYMESGQLVEKVREKTPIEEHYDGTTNYEPELLWRRTAKAIARLVESSQKPVAAVAVTGMAESGVLLDAHGGSPYPIIPWYDEQRTRKQMNALLQELSPSHWYEITGLYPSAIHTIFKWKWLEEQYPDRWNSVACWLSVPGFISHKLCGTRAMSDTQAVRTMAYDVTNNAWSHKLMDMAGLKMDFLPEVVASGMELGRVHREGHESTGLPMGTPVYDGGHDHIAAALACGAVTSDVVMDSFGTSEAITVGFEGLPVTTEARGLAVGPHVIRGSSYYIGGIYTSGGLAEWIRTVLGYDSFDNMNAEIEQVIGADAPLFLPEVIGAGPPFNEPKVRGAFVGLTGQESRAAFAYSVYEGIAHEVKLIVGRIQEVTRVTPRFIRLVGGAGGSSSNVWYRLRSTVYNMPIQLPAQQDMTTLGAALLAGIGCGVYSSNEEAIHHGFRLSAQVEPDARLMDYHHFRYEKYKSIVASLRALRLEE